MLIVYKASAGSGKTYTLAKKYISLLLGYKNSHGNIVLNLDKSHPNHLLNNDQHRSILAITFTNKATKEMKTRILKELSLLRYVPKPGEKDSDYADDLTKELKCSRGQLASAAKIALTQLLYDYQNFNISTIDAFFQRVLHTFARELDYQPDYTVELDDVAAMQAAVGAMLDDFNATKSDKSQLESWLYSYMSTKIREGKKANFFNRRSPVHTDLVELISKITMESFKPFAAKMKDYLKGNKLNKFLSHLDAIRAQVVADVKKKAESTVLDPLIGFDPTQLKKNDPVLHLLNAFSTGAPLDSIDYFSKKLVKSIVEDADEGGFKKGCGTPEQVCAIKTLFRYALERYQVFFLTHHIHSSLTQLGLLSHAWDYLLNFSKDNNVLLISDTNELVHRIIGTDEMPFIYERMGVRLSHFLIDEFQDTSKMQWDNLRPLVHNGVAGKNDSLVIGDEKQSIYRFRNSDSSILHSQIQKDFPKFIKPYFKNGDQEGRSTNYRSSADVVKFNNTIFSIMAKNAGILGFENVVQDIGPSLVDTHGYIHFIPVDFSATKPTKENPDITPKTLEEKETEVLHQMAQTILRQRNVCRYEWKDIAILVDTNKQATKVVNFLLTEYPQIEIVSDEALRLGGSAAVQLIISILKIIDQEQADTDAKDKKKKYPSRSEVLLAINRFEYFINKAQKECDGTEEDGEIEAAAIEKALSGSDNEYESSLICSIKSIIDKKPASLVALVDTIIDQQFSETDRSEQSLYLTAFQDVVINFCANNNGSLHSFLAWWDSKGDKLNVGSAAEANKVKVMTIHKSKGLEFECVLIPFCKWNQHWSSTRTPSVWTDFPDIEGFDKDLCPPAIYLSLGKHTSDESSPFYSIYKSEQTKALIDNMNKTYVAFTRAKKELTVWYDINASTRQAKDSDSFGNLIYKALAVGSNPEADTSVTVNFAEYFNPETCEFKMGVPYFKKMAEDQTDDAAHKDLLKYPVYHRTDLQDTLSLCDVLDIEKDTDDTPQEPQHIDDNYEVRMEGIMLHNMMSEIYTADCLDEAVDRISAQCRLSDTDKERYKNLISEFISQPDERLRRWFVDFKKVHIEQPIFIPNKNIIRRPDRVVINHDGTVDVIDYKFTDEPTHQHTEDQQDQVKEYMSLMRDMGYKCVRGFLCYPKLSTIIEIK